MAAALHSAKGKVKGRFFLTACAEAPSEEATLPMPQKYVLGAGTASGTLGGQSPHAVKRKTDLSVFLNPVFSLNFMLLCATCAGAPNEAARLP